MRTPATRRQGFTLVELLVSVALIVLIMAIISQAFVEGLETFRQLKAVGDLQENLRSAVVPLRNDLLAKHFQGSAKLSDPAYIPPTQGYFRIQTVPGSATLEGNDGNGIPSSTATSHILSFTVQYLGPRRSDYLSTTVPVPPALAPGNPLPLSQQGLTPDFQQSGLLLSQSAEVCWFLGPTPIGSATAPNGGGPGTPLFALFRRHRLLLSDKSQINKDPGRISSTNFGLFPEVSCKPDTLTNTALYFNDISDVVDPRKRAFMDVAGSFNCFYPMGTPYPSNSFTVAGTPPENLNLQGTDLVITNVISFEVKVLFDGHFQFEDLAVAQANNVPPQPPTGIFDTATATPTMYRLKGLQVTLRVWDPKTEQTRQVTMIQDM